MLKVGVGNISGAHIRAWESIAEATLVCICDIRTERLEKYPEIRGYTALDEMLEKEKIDILDICLPTLLHVETAIKAMDRGIHVLCEKPISLNVADVKKVYAAARRNNVKFMVAQVVRFWQEYETVREYHQNGIYGKLIAGSMWRTIPHKVGTTG